MSAYAFTPIRDVRLGEAGVEVEHRSDGTTLVRSTRPLPPYPAKLSEPLERWARQAPNRLFFAQRGPDGSWRELTYAATLAKVRSLAAALIERGLSAERPVLILSGNDLEHLLLNLACFYAGVPFVPVSPSYSLLSTDFGKLKHIVAQTTPGLVFASDGAAFARALDGVVTPDTEIAVAVNPPAQRRVTLFEELLATTPGPGTDAANAAVGPDTIAKFLFTSGSTGLPKGVINTHRMICSNQAMILASFPFLRDEPPVVVDWLPWNHTFGGNHNIGIVLFNGGTYYIDGGKPTPNGIAETVRNLREIAPTVYFNVPKGFEELVPYLRREPQLREKFFSRLKMLFFAGAGMPQHVWDDIDSLALQSCGERIVIMSGLGATESGPSALFCTKEMVRSSGAIGLPVPGIELKLAPVDGKLEARLKGPSITPGYWRQPETTAASFDEESYYKLGDAVRFADPDEPLKGFFFDGRISEDFKLSTGTWVRVGMLRASLLAVFGGAVKDVVIAGHERDDIAILIFPDFEALRTLSEDLAGAAPEEILSHGATRSLFRQKLNEAAAASTGSSNRVPRAILLEELPSIDGHEITDKGSINQRAVLARRAALVEELYSDAPSPRVISITRD
jgi:feruloyl-CoA synthase